MNVFSIQFQIAGKISQIFLIWKVYNINFVHDKSSLKCSQELVVPYFIIFFSDYKHVNQYPDAIITHDKTNK